ncbi:hypothetical protein KIW84_010626 [Lathyrus oleraceus]|uniref:Uncharacterized protein n=1 Tax=Pisum sativum TaxID=3888 RepID=A0A9D4YLR3_PEA|nr:hypothetical protein KIW84_010626 [Pisum sativum]
MDKKNSLSGPMMDRTLNVERDPFRPMEDDKEDLDSKVLFLNVIGALMYLTNFTRPDIAFVVNLLARFISYPYNAKSQSGYVFTYGDTAISCRSQKQTLVATSLIHAKVIALHEASKRCRWLRPVTRHIQEAYGLQTDNNPTILYENNVACVT